MINKEKIIDKLEKETKRTYAIKTALFDGKENKPISETIHREPFVTITIEMADKILKLLKEQEEIVRCKDCKHRPKEPNWETYVDGFDIEFSEGSKCPCQCLGDEYYSWYPEDDWFCACGERKENEQSID